MAQEQFRGKSFVQNHHLPIKYKEVMHGPGLSLSQKILNLEDKVKAQRHIKEIEKKRNALRMNLFQAQDDVDVRKEKLIDEIEARLKQKIDKKELFVVRWEII